MGEGPPMIEREPSRTAFAAEGFDAALRRLYRAGCASPHR